MPSLGSQPVQAVSTHRRLLAAAQAARCGTKTIPLAYRKPIIVLLVCSVLPFGVSMGNTMFGVGPIDFPFTVTAVVLLLPLHIYAALTLKIFEFSPLGYRTLFNHVRDPIIVLDDRHRIIGANTRAAEMLGKPERHLMGRVLWEDFPEAKALLLQSKGLDLTQTLQFREDLVYEVSIATLNNRHGSSRGTVRAAVSRTKAVITMGRQPTVSS